jgi:hydantoinase/carbamoylase family amidase
VPIAAELAEIAGFSSEEGQGVTRFAWSPELAAASDWLIQRLRELGLEAGIDAAGNVIGRWDSGSGPAVLVGSHLDSVPRAGRFDGVLGVLAGLEAIRSLKERRVQPLRPVWLASFMDEEGSRFRAGMLGSRAFVGQDVASLADRRDAHGVTLRHAMAALGFPFEEIAAARRVDEVGAYLELHIEQGPRLERTGVDVGVVTAIVGLLAFRARFGGEANHAGTTPMDARRDALAGAARAVVALREEARSRDDMTANVGTIAVEPGGFNVIPGACEFTIDVRSPTREGLTAVEGFVRDTLHRIAEEERLDLELEETHRLDPAPMDSGLIDTLERAAELEGASAMRLVSGAGHDAMILATRVPSAMLFVPSRGGISHSPEEWTSEQQCELGARVLTRAVELLVHPSA